MTIFKMYIDKMMPKELSIPIETLNKYMPKKLIIQVRYKKIHLKN